MSLSGHMHILSCQEKEEPLETGWNVLIQTAAAQKGLFDLRS